MFFSKAAPVGAKEVGIILGLKKKNNNNNKNQLISHLSAQMRTLLGLILNPSYGKPSKVGSPLLWLLSIVLLVPSPC